MQDTDENLNESMEANHANRENVSGTNGEAQANGESVPAGKGSHDERGYGANHSDEDGENLESSGDEASQKIRPPSFSIDEAGYINFRVHLSEGVYKIFGLIDLGMKPNILAYFDQIRQRNEERQKAAGLIKPGGGKFKPRVFS